jgi:geranylgeranyl diphosphate synthase type I
MPAPDALFDTRSELESALRAAIGDTPEALVAASRYVLGWQDEHGRAADNAGKRIRPALCLLGARAFGGTSAAAMSGAVAVELVHNFSLVHDEVQDHDAQRHHRPTIWALMGEGQAINVGDFLYTRAVAALTEGPGDLGRRMRALQVLNAAIARMISGQWLDISFESRDDVTVAEYLEMVAGKTGALLSAPLELGAILAGAPNDAAARFGAWGLEVGLAFQCQDDYLGIWGEPDLTGKSNSNDIARRKKTLPVIHGMKNADEGAAIRRAYAASEVPVGIVTGALDRAGAAEACREQARRHIREADAILESMGFDTGWKTTFRAVGAYLVDRDA